MDRVRRTYGTHQLVYIRKTRPTIYEGSPDFLPASTLFTPYLQASGPASLSEGLETQTEKRAIEYVESPAVQSGRKKSNLSKGGKGKDGGQGVKGGNKGGCSQGSENFSERDLDVLNQYVEALLPVGMNSWDAVAFRYNKWARVNGCMERTRDAIRQRFYKVHISNFPL